MFFSLMFADKWNPLHEQARANCWEAIDTKQQFEYDNDESLYFGDRC